MVHTAERSVTVPYIGIEKSPDSEEPGDFPLLFVPIRRAETSDRSGGFCSRYSKPNLPGSYLPRAKPGTPSGY